MSDEAPEPRVEPLRRSLLERVSIVWIVPLGALLISLGLAWQSYSQRGPTIEIAFQNASGVQAGETELHYRDVAVGLVEDVRFSNDLATVVVEVRLESDVAPFVDAESEFWVVRPQVTAQGVSGLNTVLSGVYIEGSWDNVPGGLHRRFEGALAPPLARPDQSGLSIVLSSVSGEGLLEGTPVLYRGVHVGSVANVRLSDDGISVLADAFIEAPHDRLVTEATRFWDTSGFAFTLGPQGATLDVSSLAALVSGGVAFDRLVAGGDPVEDGATFQLFSDRDAAQASIFSDPDEGERVLVSIIFTGDAAGLSAGSPVDLRGVRVGEVAAITGYVDEERFGDRRVRLLATVELRPEKLGVPGELTAADTYAFLDELVASGVRAQLARGNILTGGLKVNLVEILEPAPAEFEADAEPYPILPSIPADLPDVAATAEGVFRRINALPIEELLDTTLSILGGVETLIASDAVQAAPDEALALVDDLRGLVGSEAAQALPAQAGELLAKLETATANLATVLEQIDAAETVPRLTAALASAAEAGETIAGLARDLQPAVAEIPAVTERVGAIADAAAALVEQAAALPLDTLVTEAAATAAAARSLIDNPEVQAVPDALANALGAVEATLDEIRAADLVAQAGETLTATAEAADAVSRATTQLPDLVARITSVADAAEQAVRTVAELPLGPLVTEATDLVQSASTLVGNPATRRVPQELADALAAIDALLARMAEAGLVETLTGAVASADRAAGAVAAAAEGLPGLVERVDGIAASVAEVADEVAALPLDALTAETTQAAAALSALLALPDLQAVPADVSSVLAGLETAIAEFRAADLAAEAASALRSANEAAAAVTEATAGLPALVSRVEGLAATLAELPLRPAVDEVTGLAAALRALAASDAVAALPSAAAATLAELQAAVAEARAADLIASADSALASAGDAAAAVERAAADVPTLVDNLTGLAETANALPLAELVTQATAVADAAEVLLRADGAQDLPTSLNAALAELQATLAELRAGGLIDNATATLASTERAADAVAEATRTLPDLVARLDQLASQASTTLDAYGAEGPLTRDAQAALREVRNAARSVSSLARTIERSPNSLLLGR